MSTTPQPPNPRDFSAQTVGKDVRLLINLTLRAQAEVAAQTEVLAEILAHVPECGLEPTALPARLFERARVYLAKSILQIGDSDPRLAQLLDAEAKQRGLYR